MQKRTTKLFGVSLLSPAKHNKNHMYEIKQRDVRLHSVHTLKSLHSVINHTHISSIKDQKHKTVLDALIGHHICSGHRRGTVYGFTKICISCCTHDGHQDDFMGQ